MSNTLGAPKIDVVIVSWNVCGALQKCLESLQTLVSQEVRVVVVDNASVDASADMVRRDYPRVRLIQSPRNIGFAAANNLALQGSSADYLVLLNPDAYVSSNFFQELEVFFAAHPAAGVVGGKILNQDSSLQQSVRGWPSVWSSVLDSLKLLRRLPGLASDYLKPRFEYDRAQPVEQVMGACFAVRGSVWRSLGGFDEHFFVWFEEVDFCKRASEQGSEVWYDPQLIVHHLGAASFKQLDPLKRHSMFNRSLVYYVRKHKGKAAAAAVWCTGKIGLVFLFILTHVFHKQK